MSSVVDKVALGQVSVRAVWFSPATGHSFHPEFSLPGIPVVGTVGPFAVLIRVACRYVIALAKCICFSEVGSAV